MRGLAAICLATAVASFCACDDTGGPEGPAGDIDYYCARYASAWCPAYRECDPFEFPSAFRSLEDCLEQTEADCLDPPAGRQRCVHATVEETDACVAYIDGSYPDECSNLFGRSADMTPCTDICVE